METAKGATDIMSPMLLIGQEQLRKYMAIRTPALSVPQDIKFQTLRPLASTGFDALNPAIKESLTSSKGTGRQLVARPSGDTCAYAGGGCAAPFSRNSAHTTSK